MSDLRPTLFLAQLSNLLAGNISIVHGVTGSSRTFMGEESAGVEAVRVAHARIQASQSDLALVGGAYNAERWEVMLHFALGRRLARGEHDARLGAPSGMELGTIGAFLVLEEKAHAQARGAKPFARIAAVASDHVKRAPGAVTAALERMWGTIAPQLDAAQAAVISGASGVAPATEEERAFSARQNLAVRATGTHLGHGLEPQFPANIALAAAALRAGKLFPPAMRRSKAMDAAGLRQVVVTSIGHWRGEGLALVEAID